MFYAQMEEIVSVISDYITLVMLGAANVKIGIETVHFSSSNPFSL